MIPNFLKWWNGTFYSDPDFLVPSYCFLAMWGEKHPFSIYFQFFLKIPLQQIDHSILPHCEMSVNSISSEFEKAFRLFHGTHISTMYIPESLFSIHIGSSGNRFLFITIGILRSKVSVLRQACIYTIHFYTNVWAMEHAWVDGKHCRMNCKYNIHCTPTPMNSIHRSGDRMGNPYFFMSMLNVGFLCLTEF